MNSSENISNAVQVLYKTYENVQKLMEYCKAIAGESGYTCIINRFLRWKSDNDYNGWLLNDFIVLFQKESDSFYKKNKWHDGPVYVMEIKLGDIDDALLNPTVYLSKFTYNDIKSWSEGCSVSSHAIFYWPLRNINLFSIEHNGEYGISRPKNEKTGDAFWGLKYVITQSFELTTINVNNVKDKIFGAFDELSQKTI